MMTNVVLLRPAECRDPEIQSARLIRSFAKERRAQGDVFWLKENAELLGVLASTGAALEAEAPLGSVAPRVLRAADPDAHNRAGQKMPPAGDGSATRS